MPATKRISFIVSEMETHPPPVGGTPAHVYDEAMAYDAARRYVREELDQSPAVFLAQAGPPGGLTCVVKMESYKGGRLLREDHHFDVMPLPWDHMDEQIQSLIHGEI